MLAPLGSSGCRTARRGRLARARGAHQQGTGAALEPAAEQLVQLGQTAGELVHRRPFGGAPPRPGAETLQAATDDDEIVIARRGSSRHGI